MPATPIANLVVGDILREVCDRAYFKCFERKKLAEKKAAAALNEMVSHIVNDVVDHVVHEEPVENCLETIIPSPEDKVLDFFDRMQDPTEDTEAEEVEMEPTEETKHESLEAVTMEDESETANFPSSVVANIGSSTRQSSVYDDESEAGNSSPEPEVVNISSDEETNDDVDTSILITPELTESSSISFAQAKVSASVQTEMSTFDDASVQTEAISCDATVRSDTFRQFDQATQVEPEGLVAANVPLEVCQLSKIATELEKSGTVNQLTVRK